MADFEFLTSFIALKVNQQSFNTALAKFRALETEVLGIIKNINSQVIKAPTVGGKVGKQRPKNQPISPLLGKTAKELQNDVATMSTSILNSFSKIRELGASPFIETIQQASREMKRLKTNFSNALRIGDLAAAEKAMGELAEAQTRANMRAQQAIQIHNQRAAAAGKAAAAERSLTEQSANIEQLKAVEEANRKVALARKEAFANIAGTNIFGRAIAKVSTFVRKLSADFATLTIGARIAAVAMRALNTAIEALAFGAIKLGTSLIKLPLRTVALGINLIKTAVKGLLSPLISVTRAFRFFSRSIFPFLGFGLLTLGLRNAVTEFASFEENVARSLDLAAKSQRDFAGQNRDLFLQVQDQLRDIARTTIFTAEEVANTFNLLVRGGLELEEALASVKPTVDLAIATRGTPEDAAQLINVVRNQFGLVRDEARKATFSVEDYTKAVGDLADTLVFATKSAPVEIQGFRVALEQTGEVAAQVGLTLEETTALLIRLFEGLPAPSKVGTGLSRAIVRALKPTEAGLKRIDAALQGTGKNLNDFFEGQKFKPGGFVELIEELQRAGVGIGGLVDIFGFRTRAVARLFAEFEGGTNTFAAYTRELKKAQKENLAQAIADDVAQNTLFGSLKLLRSEFAELKTSIFNNLINLGLVDFIKRIRDGVRAVSAFIKNFKTFEDAIAGLREAFTNIADAAAEALKPIANFLLVLNAAVLAAGLGALEAGFRRLKEGISGFVQLGDVVGFELFGIRNIFSSINGAVEAATVLLVNYRKVFKAAVLAGYIAVLRASIAIRDAFKGKGFFSGIFTGAKIALNKLLDIFTATGRAIGAAIGLGLSDQLKKDLGNLPLIGGTFERFLASSSEKVKLLEAELEQVNKNIRFGEILTKSLGEEFEEAEEAVKKTFFLLPATKFFRKIDAAAAGLQFRKSDKALQKLKVKAKELTEELAGERGRDPALFAENTLAEAKKLIAEVKGFALGDIFKAEGATLEEQLQSALELLKKFPDELEPLNKEQRKSLDSLRKRLKEALRVNRKIEDALKVGGADADIRFLGLEEFGRLINTAFDPKADPVVNEQRTANIYLTSIDQGIARLNDTMNDIRSRGGLPARALDAATQAAPYAQPLIPTALSYLLPRLY